jgi:hypothetical protein
MDNANDSGLPGLWAERDFLKSCFTDLYNIQINCQDRFEGLGYGQRSVVGIATNLNIAYRGDDRESAS